MHGVNLTNCRGLVVLVCVRTQGVPSVATRVVAKIYRLLLVEPLPLTYA